MLIVSRRIRQSLVVGELDGMERALKVTVLAIRGGKVILGIDLENDTPQDRATVSEFWNAAHQTKKQPKVGPSAVVENVDKWEVDGETRRPKSERRTSCVGH